jgi:HSP20 family protein
MVAVRDAKGEVLSAAEKPRRGPSPANRILEQIQSKGFYGFYSNENWTPSVNLYESESSYLVCVDLAGVEKEKIEIEVDGSLLTLRGSRAVPTNTEAETGFAGEKRLRVHLMEIDYGSFARQVELPENVHRENISARHINGLLWIELPKKR